MSDAAITPFQSIQRSLTAAFIIIAILVFGIGGWAATIPLEGAVVAQGSLVVDSNVKKVQHLSGGIIKEIRVREGDHVKAGDILVRLDETQTKASNSVVTANLDELVAQQARLEAERDGGDHVEFPATFAQRAREPNSDAARTMICRTEALRVTAGSPRREKSAAQRTRCPTEERNPRIRRTNGSERARNCSHQQGARRS